MNEQPVKIFLQRLGKVKELGFAPETEALTNCTRKLMELVNEETRD